MYVFCIGAYRYSSDRNCDDKLYLSIEYGKGIPQKELEKIKEPFYTLHKDRNRNLSGMGLGLPLCLKMVEVMKGRLEIRSIEGDGTEITIQLGVETLQWARVKKFWKSEIIVIEEEPEKIIATMQILIRKIPLFGNLMYVPRGPIGAIQEEAVWKKLTEQIQEIARKYKAFVIIIEPNVLEKDEAFKKMVTKLGYKINSTAMKFEEEIQARHNFRLHLEGKTEETVFQSFSSKTRYNIRQAQKKGVRIEEKTQDGLEEFYTLMQETGRRNCFRIRQKEYFERLLKEFPEEIQIWIAYYEEEPIATVMPIIYGNKMWYLYGASGNQYRKWMPNYLLQWEMIKKAIQNKCIVYDFRGVSVEKGEEDGLYRFKKGFGGDFVELIGEVYMDFKPLRYRFYKIAKKVFCNMRYGVYCLKMKWK